MGSTFVVLERLQFLLTYAVRNCGVFGKFLQRERDVTKGVLEIWDIIIWVKRLQGLENYTLAMLAWLYMMAAVCLS